MEGEGAPACEGDYPIRCKPLTCFHPLTTRGEKKGLKNERPLSGQILRRRRTNTTDRHRCAISSRSKLSGEPPPPLLLLLQHYLLTNNIKTKETCVCSHKLLLPGGRRFFPSFLFSFFFVTFPSYIGSGFHHQKMTRARCRSPRQVHGRN